MTYIALREGPTSIAVGEVHARLRHGEPALELRRCTYHADPAAAAEAALMRSAACGGPELPPVRPMSAHAWLAGLTLKPQAREVIVHLLDHGSITARDAALQLGCWRLSARIMEIRRALGEGSVETIREPHPDGHHARYEWRGV